MKPKLIFDKDTDGNIRIGLCGFGTDISIFYVINGKEFYVPKSHYCWGLTLKSLVNMMFTRYYYPISRKFILTTYFFLFKKKIMKEVEKLLVKEML